jgi:hypothetical protein
MKAYRVIAYTIAALVVVQAFAIAWGFFGLSDWISNDNGVLNKQTLENAGESEMLYAAEIGFAIHMFFVGTILIPLASIVLLVVSFFAKVPGGVVWAAAILGLVVLQVFVLPALSRAIDPSLGGLHGLNAMVIFAVAVMAGKRVSKRAAAAPPSQAAHAAV